MTAPAATDADRWLETPADKIAVDPDSARLSANEWAGANYGHGQPLDPVVHMGFEANGHDESQPIDDYSQVDPATLTTRRMMPAAGWPGNMGSKKRGSVTIATHPGDFPARGNDAQRSIRMPDGSWVNTFGESGPGTEHGNPGVTQSRGLNPLTDWGLQLQGMLPGHTRYTPFDPNKDGVAASVEVIPAGAQGNAFLSSDAIPEHNGIPRATDALAGRFTQAMAMWVATSLCPPPGVANVMPAATGPQGIPSTKLWVPTAQRFHLIPAKVDISSWLIARAYTGLLADLAEMAAVCLIDLGWVNVGYTGTKAKPSGPALLPWDGSTSAQVIWRHFGVTSAAIAGHLLDGLIQPDAIEALQPPLGVLANGKGTTRTHGKVSSFAVT